MTPTATPPAPVGTAGSPFAEIDGMVMLEAENAQAVVAGGDHAWTPATEHADFAGSGYMVAELDVGTVVEAVDVGATTELRFDVAFATEGTYVVWVRGWVIGGGGDSIHVGLDDGGATTAANIYGFVPGGWSWSHLRAGGGIATLEVTSAGVHTVHIWMREDGFALDRLILTVDVGYAPNGKGPRPSPRVDDVAISANVESEASTASQEAPEQTVLVASGPADRPPMVVAGDGTGGET